MEISPDSLNSMNEISAVLNARLGACLIIDYGDDKYFENSLRGIKEHKFTTEHDILNLPGLVDLSANVNFIELANIVKLYPNCIFQHLSRQKK